MQSQHYWIERAFQNTNSYTNVTDHQARKRATWHRHTALVMMAQKAMLLVRNCYDIQILSTKMLLSRNIYEIDQMEFDLNDPSLMFATDNLENSALTDMEYIGVIPSKVFESPDAPVPEINRVFKHEAGYLYLTEAAMSESGALLQQEFVNKSVKGYPATQMTYCAPSERCITSLSWLTFDKRYELSLRGDIKHLGENELESIANTLNLPPIPDNKAAEE